MLKKITILTIILTGFFLFGLNSVHAQDIAQVKAICLSIANSAPGATGFVDKCNDIDLADGAGKAVNICVDVAESVSGFLPPTLGDSETVTEANIQRCQDAGAGAVEKTPATGEGEVSEEEALKGVYDGISRFGNIGLIGTDKSIPDVIGGILKVLLGIVGALALVMFIYGGVMFMFSEGDSGRVKTARDILIWAALGLLTVFASFTVLNFVISNL
ncbi:hypothetical protein COT97_04870 [Candidatus Falkowbacteria bacterium CG10_big_fil_rev_8_21_14_0_10_39_11]|uniref:Uncharacterized protein n=1 Tax=Candidatus Falkowbacteria bacterium CG10_big_fil_rev_8_21_14_0_10_39_11 TaxID=1974565 RepID=A0A2H0V3V2_9BACT|nr:MAG: hypothetical protein COT97_04870 [Candidatus Falkowbacteria bacterium CG10_big_fil_rev_8_21_14_0_10_39_11]